MTRTFCTTLFSVLSINAALAQSSPLPISGGGTGQTTAGAAFNALGANGGTVGGALTVSGTSGIVGGANGTNTGVPVGASGNSGYVRLVPSGSSSTPGYIEFDPSSGQRKGYAGFLDGGGNLLLSGPWARDTQPATASNDGTIDTTANSQNRLSHVANAAAVAGWSNTAFPVEVDGYATPGDGGRKRMVYDSANRCGAGGHPAADGVTCVNSTIGAGSWNIDLSSTNFVVPVSLFEPNAGQNTNSVAVETAALKAALATGYDVFLPSGQYNISAGAAPASAPSYSRNGQRLFGAGSSQTIVYCYLPGSPGTTNPCLTGC